MNFRKSYKRISKQKYYRLIRWHEKRRFQEKLILKFGTATGLSHGGQVLYLYQSGESHKCHGQNTGCN
jgi:hypothetical protein